VRIDQLLAHNGRPVFSFEFFPPKTDEGEENLARALRDLQPLNPDYVSVTYGAAAPRARRRSTWSRASRATSAWRRWRT
jgi:methylenetetrahydrofolate reductase (NADPH)